MASLYPPEPAFPQDGGAERDVCEHLRDGLPAQAAVFAGLRFLDGAAEHEIDALVVWPGVGLAAVETKGGYISRAGGEWFQGNGDKRHRIDPVAQVQAARHALQHLLTRTAPAAAPARTAHLVAFPHVYVPSDWSAPDLPRDMLIDRSDVEAGPGAVAARVRRAVERHGQGHAPLTDAGAADLLDYLCGPLPSQVESLALAAEHESRLERMTAEQGKVLDVARDLPRVVVVGGAGSGKTWLALEHARRRARAGDRVALVCYSRGLGRYLERSAHGWPQRERPAYAGPFHDLAVAWGAETGPQGDPDYWEHRLPARLGELAALRADAERFDTIVVDEAQDFAPHWWPPLLRCLRDPAGGGLFVATDEAQRVFDRPGQAPAGLVPLRLSENLRSTKPIAQLISSLADGEATPRGLAGPPVRLVDVPAREAVGAADDAVDALLSEGWRPGDVALLTTHHRHPEQVNAVDVGGHAAYWDAFLGGEDVFYGHVLNFKGLERPAVVLAVDGFRDGSPARKILYTGMSRARSLLVVAGPRALVEEVGGAGVARRLTRAQAWLTG